MVWVTGVDEGVRLEIMVMVEEVIRLFILWNGILLIYANIDIKRMQLK